jgi:hypothetical protein
LSSPTRLLSITGEANRSGERGQVLVLFAGGVLALLVVAALAFDVGMMLLERRDQQNAADAAALAGARYVIPSGTFNGVCPDAGLTGNQAVDAACAIVRQNGFDHAADSGETIHVYIPPQHGRYRLLDDFIEVSIDTARPSIFAGVLGKATWPVSVFGVATDDHEVNLPFSMLALNERSPDMRGHRSEPNRRRHDQHHGTRRDMPVGGLNSEPGQRDHDVYPRPELLLPA